MTRVPRFMAGIIAITAMLLIVTGVSGPAYAQGGSGKKAEEAKVDMKKAGKSLFKGLEMIQGGIMMIQKNEDVTAGKKMIADGRKMMVEAAKEIGRDSKLLADKVKVAGLTALVRGATMCEEGMKLLLDTDNKATVKKMMQDGQKMMTAGKKAMMGEGSASK